MQQEHSPVERKKGDLSNRWWLVLILAIGAALQVWGNDEKCFHDGEVYEVVRANGDAKEILSDPDGLPPIYGITLWSWLKIWGTDSAARWLSQLFAFAALLVIYFLGKELWNTRVGLWASFLFAVTPFRIFYAQEARMYSLYLMCAAFFIWFFLRSLRTDRYRDWFGFFLSAAAGVSTHYYFISLLGLISLFYVGQKGRKVFFTRGIYAICAIGVYTLALLVVFLSQDFQFQVGFGKVAEFDIEAFGYTYFSFLGGYSLGPTMTELRELSSFEGLLRMLPWVLWMGFSLAVLAWYAVRELRKNRKVAWFLGLLLIVPVPVIGIVGNLGHVGYYDRYVVWVSIPFFLLLAIGIVVSIDRKLTKVAILSLAIVFSIAEYNLHCERTYREPELLVLREAMQHKERSPIVVVTPFMTQAVRYYFADEWTVLGEVIHNRVSAEERTIGISQLSIELSGSKTFWLFSVPRTKNDPRITLRDSLEKRNVIQYTKTIGHVFVYQGDTDKLKEIAGQPPKAN